MSDRRRQLTTILRAYAAEEMDIDEAVRELVHLHQIWGCLRLEAGPGATDAQRLLVARVNAVLAAHVRIDERP